MKRKFFNAVAAVVSGAFLASAVALLGWWTVATPYGTAASTAAVPEAFPLVEPPQKPVHAAEAPKAIGNPEDDRDIILNNWNYTARKPKPSPGK